MGKKGDEPAGLGVGDEMLMGGECFVERFLPRCRILSIPRLCGCHSSQAQCSDVMEGLSMRRGGEEGKEEEGGRGGKERRRKKEEMEQTTRCE